MQAMRYFVIWNAGHGLSTPIAFSFAASLHFDRLRREMAFPV
jgi:hypothetical protein